MRIKKGRGGGSETMDGKSLRDGAQIKEKSSAEGQISEAERETRRWFVWRDTWRGVRWRELCLGGGEKQMKEGEHEALAAGDVSYTSTK